MMSFRTRGLATALVSVALAATASPALARPPAKPGAPGNLALSATKPASGFDVNATWSAGNNATKYVVRLSSAGVTLSTATVTNLTYTGHTTRPDGSTITVQVTSYNGNRRGGSSTSSLLLPDLTPPAASYSVTHNPANTGPDVTVTAVTLADNLTPKANLTQTVNWGDGSPVAPWPTANATINHLYADAEARYEASVTVTDAANNVATYPLVVVVKDTEAPTGTYALMTNTAWASWTKVSLGQAAIHDNLSPNDKIARVISWGDGAQSIWAAGTNPTHMYAAAGSYHPSVRLTDEAGNQSAVLETSTVVVRLDSAKPTIKLLPPTARKAYVSSWRTLKGRAADAQTGVRNVSLRAIEKRGTSWFAYKAATHTWVKVGRKAAAWRKATAVVVKPAAAGTWSVKVARLTKGTLVYKARAFDNRANASAWVVKQAALTKR